MKDKDGHESLRRNLPAGKPGTVRGKGMTQPGWYPDQSGGPNMKYWDGQRWHDAIPAAQPLQPPHRAVRRPARIRIRMSHRPRHRPMA